MVIGRLKFNNVQAMIDLRLHLIVVMTQLQQELLAESRAGMKTSDGPRDLTPGKIQDVAGVISASIVGGPYAILDEFGKGSLMDRDNPALGNYIRGPTWNPVRNDYTIRGRPAGSQQTMFGQQTFKGNAPGVDLERLAEEGILGPEYLPHPPSRAVRTAMRWMMQGRFQKVIMAAVHTFPWYKYLIITVK